MTNSERYKTAEERVRAFGKWHEKYCGMRGVCAKDDVCAHTVFHWLDMEAEEEKIENCPYCGGSCLVSNGAVGTYSVFGKYRVFCEKNLSCMYSSGAYTTEHEAIDAHNRVARAVMDAGKKEVK